MLNRIVTSCRIAKCIFYITLSKRKKTNADFKFTIGDFVKFEIKMFRVITIIRIMIIEYDCELMTYTNEVLRSKLVFLKDFSISL